MNQFLLHIFYPLLKYSLRYSGCAPCVMRCTQMTTPLVVVSCNFFLYCFGVPWFRGRQQWTLSRSASPGHPVFRVLTGQVTFSYVLVSVYLKTDKMKLLHVKLMYTQYLLLCFSACLICKAYATLNSYFQPCTLMIL